MMSSSCLLCQFNTGFDDNEQIIISMSGLSTKPALIADYFI
jgi:hypothetical protein